MRKIMNMCFLLTLLVLVVHVYSKPTDNLIPEKAKVDVPIAVAPEDVNLLTFSIDYFLVRKELQYALQDVISYKEASTSIIDPLADPEPVFATQTRYVLEALRVTAFYAYDKLIFLANAKLLTLTYATQTFSWYENAFNHFTDRIGILIDNLDDTTRDNLQLLLDQIISQTTLHHYNVKLLLTAE